jgi:hypothetical protein
MKHVLDKSDANHSVTSLRHAYSFSATQRPAQATLALQKRSGHKKTGASKTRQFLRIEREGRV